MAVQVTYPGVYVQEVPSGVRTIVGVSTSIGCFVGRTKSGPLSTPRRIQTFTDFARLFGDDASVGDLARYVRLFFLNGGSDCYVTRIANGALSSSITLQNEAKADVLTISAVSAGTLGQLHSRRHQLQYAGAGEHVQCRAVPEHGRRPRAARPDQSRGLEQPLDGSELVVLCADGADPEIRARVGQRSGNRRPDRRLLDVDEADRIRFVGRRRRRLPGAVRRRPGRHLAAEILPDQRRRQSVRRRHHPRRLHRYRRLPRRDRCGPRDPIRDSDRQSHQYRAERRRRPSTSRSRRVRSTPRLSPPPS